MYNLKLDIIVPKSRQALLIIINKIDLDKEDIDLLLTMEDAI